MTARTVEFSIYRFDPDRDEKPYMQSISLELDGTERKLLGALVKLKDKSMTRCPSVARAAKVCAARTR
jgi:succinate dehydrogenase / fumarate reductase iron-sulfur subunit